MTVLDLLARWALDGDIQRLRIWAALHKSKRSRLRARKAPRIARERATKAQSAENWQRTRETVLARAVGRCDLCLGPTYALECHHLAPGPLRRKYEAPNSVVAACPGCHRGWHRGDAHVLQASIEAAQRIGAPDIVQASLHRRLQKATR